MNPTFSVYHYVTHFRLFFKIYLCMLRAPLAHFFKIVDAQMALRFCLFVVIPVLQICNLCQCVFTYIFMCTCVCVCEWV